MSAHRNTRECNWTVLLTCTVLLLSACSRTPPAEKAETTPARETTVVATRAVKNNKLPVGSEVAGAGTGEVTMTTGQGKTVTLTMQTLAPSRGYRYCELVFDYGAAGYDIYSTSPLAEASLEWWGNLDVKALAREFGAQSVFKNGPQWWSMDEVGVMASKPVPVAGVNMVFGAHLPPGTLNTPKYKVFNPAKTQNLVWKAGKRVYQLVDPDGHVYILQGHKVPADSLATLGERFQRLPEGWAYRVNVLTEDLVMKLTPRAPIPSVQDEFDQIYIRISQ